MAKIIISVKAQESLRDFMLSFLRLAFQSRCCRIVKKISEPASCKSQSKWFIITTKTQIPYLSTTFGILAAIPTP